MTKFSPAPWSPPKAPSLTGDFEENQRLRDAELITIPGAGPEDVVVDANGNLLTGTEDGTILRIDPGGSITPIADVGGRPLGIELYGDDLLICNAYLGLRPRIAGRRRRCPHRRGRRLTADADQQRIGSTRRFDLLHRIVDALAA